MKVLSYTYLFLVLSIASCKDANKKEYTLLSGNTMGTVYNIKYLDDQERTIQPSIDSLLKSFNQSVSTYIPTSEISLFNTSDGLPQASELFLNIFFTAQHIYQKTEGAFDPTVMPLVNAWGFGYTQPTHMPTDKAIDSIMTFVGMDKVSVTGKRIEKKNTKTQLDFSAIAKGFGVDLVAEFLEKKGIEHFMVEIGGEVVCKGNSPSASPWKIGIETPTANARGIKQVVKLQNVAMATSGNYRNFRLVDGQKYAHTIDPVGGLPVQHTLLSVSIVAKDCMTADAYATACMVLGKEKSMVLVNSLKGVEAYFIFDQNGQMKTAFTEGFSNYL